MSPTERIAELEETVHQLRVSLCAEPERRKVDALQVGLKLTRHQALILAALHDAGPTWLPADRLDMALPARADDPRDPRTVKVQICRLRQALGHDAILHYTDVGYTLGAPGVLACKRALREAGLP